MSGSGHATVLMTLASGACSGEACSGEACSVMSTSAPDVDAAAVIASWSRAEESLYGTLLCDPDTYERVVGLVGALVAHLRLNVHDVAGLVDASRAGPALIEAVGGSRPGPALGADAGVAAACALRHRELMGEDLLARRRSALVEAHRAGQVWADLPALPASPGVGPSGATEWLSSPAAGPSGAGGTSSRAALLRVHVRSGLGIACATEMDPESGALAYVARAVSVDTSSGGLLDLQSPIEGEWSSPTLDERDRDLEEMSRQIELVAERSRVL